MQPTFIHLHLHTEYSVCDGLLRIDALLQRAVTLGMPALAITDQSNLFAAVKFYQAALKLGVKPIIGVDIFLKNESDINNPHRLLLFCQDNQGYQNLLRLVSRSYLEGQHLGKPMVEASWIQENAPGLIAIFGQESDLGRSFLQADASKSQALLKFWRAIFSDRFYLELTRVGRAGEADFLRSALDFAENERLPVVASNDVRFLLEDDFEAHEARVCIVAGNVLADPKRPRLYTEQQYLRSPAEMSDLFCNVAGALENSVEIAKRCNVILHIGSNFLPVFPLPPDTPYATDKEYFTAEAKAGLQDYLNGFGFTESASESYWQRLAYELDVIIKMGFASYFLIVADFIRWAKEQGIPVGVGRGSGAGSLVAFVLGITGIDPIVHELLFERFLNPERVSLPDFDIDFCMFGRDRVIEYVINRYGKDKVAQIITYGTMAARAVVRDVGRVLGYPYGFVDKIAKLIPFVLAITLEEALKQEEMLSKMYKQDDEVRELIDLALKIEGIVRNVGKHAGGVVIAPSQLIDFTPLYREANEAENIITQFDKDDIEKIGLVKFDFLGLRTLTVIDLTLKTINAKKAKQGEAKLDITRLPLDDIKTFQLLKACSTAAVFQLESRGMTDLVRRLQPDRFNDIVALTALYRPGPLQSGMVEDFIARKHGKAPILYPHKSLEPVLKPTYGVILYQEQVMQIAQVLSGYTLGGADILRRAMGKKKAEEMALQRAIFIDGALKNGVDKHLANGVFDLMEHFAGYGFNKSHSVAYAMLAYQTAWLKAHYPAEFMAAVLSLDMANTDKIVRLIAECKSMDLRIVAPDINASDFLFTVADDGSIVYGLGAIKGVGEAAIEAMLLARKEAGAFASLLDLCKRVDRRKMSRKVLEALTYAGALDKIAPHRGAIFASIDNALKMAEQAENTKKRGQFSLFDLDETAEGNTQAFTGYLETASWSKEQLLQGEKNSLGFYISGHPIEKYFKELKQFVSGTIAELLEEAKGKVVVAGLITAFKPLLTKNNKRMAILRLEDITGSIEVLVFSDLYETVRSGFDVDQVAVVEGEISLDNFSGNLRLLARKFSHLEDARQNFAKALVLKLNEKECGAEKMRQLTAALQPYRGGTCPVVISYLKERGVDSTTEGGPSSQPCGEPKHEGPIKSNIVLGEAWRITLKDSLLHELSVLFGAENVNIQY